MKLRFKSEKMAHKYMQLNELWSNGKVMSNKTDKFNQYKTSLGFGTLDDMLIYTIRRE